MAAKMLTASRAFRSARVKINVQACCALLVLFFAATGGCKKDRQIPDYPAGSNENINSWVLDSLKRYYYWSDALPSNPDISLAPKTFFSSVRFSEDRFSWLLLPSDPSTNIISVRSKYGFDYSVIQDESSQQVVGVVKFVLSESPAARAGIKRGDYLSRINGKRLSKDNAESLLGDLLAGNSSILTMADVKTDAVTETVDINLSSGLTFEQAPVHQIIETGSKKIGYLYLNNFNRGLASSLTATFADFKAAGITDLVFDLRYNSGGEVAEAAGLCAMIAPAVSYNSPFIIYSGNKNGGTRKESFGEAATFDGTVNFNVLLQNNLNLPRLYVLGTGATASAAEVVINNLKPYMQVILVGEKTMGKDQASFMIADQRPVKKVDWQIYPIVYKIANASGQGAYRNGISPDVAVDELAYLPLAPLGSLNDPLLSAVVNQQLNTSSRQSARLARPVKLLSDSRRKAAEQAIVITHR